mmetsp:Transcript_5572/g.23151  ORF Transcript_5572/g.23151 Transcript_5572/m.23151 type:complete len:274 (-) Transcript_5572:697-1518(-)
MGSATSAMCSKTTGLLRPSKPAPRRPRRAPRATPRPRVRGVRPDDDDDDLDKPGTRAAAHERPPPGVEPLLLPAVLHTEAIAGDEARYEVGLDATPRNAADAAAFDKYCPICMRYFQGIFATQCCGHHVCAHCAVEFVCRFEAAQLEGSSASSTKPRCPCCNVDGLELFPVLGAARSYDDDAGVRRAALPCSPVRVGASDAELRRKLLAFENAMASKESVDGDDDVVASQGGEESPNTVLSSAVVSDEEAAAAADGGLHHHHHHATPPLVAVA